MGRRRSVLMAIVESLGDTFLTNPFVKFFFNLISILLKREEKPEER
jgi:hypothetical protein